MIPFPDKKYSIIYADPPWSFSRGSKGGSEKQPTHYERMESYDIARLPVEDISEKNALLFMWTTSSHLPDSLMVMESWGFRYNKVGFVWVKTYDDGRAVCGLGGLTRNSCEFCLIGVRGKGIERLDKGVRQLIQTTALRHSEKPPHIRRRIESLCGDVPRIELFARQRVPGWDAWGNEVTPE